MRVVCIKQQLTCKHHNMSFSHGYFVLSSGPAHSTVQYSSPAVLFTNLPSSCPSCVGYSAGLGVVSVIMIVSLTGNIVLVIGCVLISEKTII